MDVSESGDSLVVVDEGDRLKVNGGEVRRETFFSVSTRKTKRKGKRRRDATLLK